jgi:bZIP-type transcription factor MBZ1
MSTQHIKSQSPAASQPGSVDTLVDSMLDLSGYDDTAAQYHPHSHSHSPSLSPAAPKNLTPFARSVPATVQSTQGSLLSASSAQPLTGPSHQYDLYKQQTGIVPGALANTLQVNQNNAHIGGGYQQFDIDAYFGNMNDGFDFNASPAQAAMDMDFDSPSAADQSLFFGDSTVNPNAIGGHEDHGLPSPPGVSSQNSVGRVWPGIHQQAALAKAQAQQRQQQHIIAQQQQQRRTNQQSRQQRPKGAAQPTDPIVEQKITQLLNSMRAKSSGPESQNSAPLLNLPRPRKDEDDMDEDERLLASEEGKKLSSKERRQLRNKVSARAFRSRRKGKLT